jgi:hypothetical protein
MNDQEKIKLLEKQIELLEKCIELMKLASSYPVYIPYPSYPIPQIPYIQSYYPYQQPGWTSGVAGTSQYINTQSVGNHTRQEQIS